ncbi:hypothetical protein MO973_36460 [Paenibacillus sp. TRM 82003]|uniref:hypothetical protein n=1 Tax=Kineococcus sp. TRM81007 TaxID=2925831 RepID=UPI001F58AABE|nr:hypothetical protein [Kineococcus sp. TRM81007]MCI2239989.1 hypothetical protein [Kineococcus sp. TRM81007]MCI3925706.1 hypothetical protein [Paenibacillus sp. TRM 82003]
MGDGRDESRSRQSASIDAVLREVLRQGRLDPGAERLAAQGVDRLRTFLAGDASVNDGTGRAAAAEATAEAVDAEAVDAEVVEEAGGVGAPEQRLRHVVPLRGGERVEVVVPERFTRADARRVAAVLEALALDDDEEEAQA